MAKDPCSTEWADSNSTVWHANSRQIFHLSIGNLANCGVWSSTNHHISSVLKGDVLLIGAVDEELCSESRGVTQAINYLTDRWGRRLDMLKQQVGLAQSNPTDSPKHFNAGQALPTAAIPSLEADHQRHCSLFHQKYTRKGNLYFCSFVFTWPYLLVNRPVRPGTHHTSPWCQVQGHHVERSAQCVPHDKSHTMICTARNRGSQK